MDAGDRERFEAAVLGCSLRQRLVHSVREEYVKIVLEVESGSDSLLACRDVHWPVDCALCFPVFTDSSVTRDSLTVGQASASTDKSPDLQQQLQPVEAIENGRRGGGGGGGTKSQNSESDTCYGRHTTDEDDTAVVDEKPVLHCCRSLSEHPFPTERDRDKDDSYSQLGSESPTQEQDLQPTTRSSTSTLQTRTVRGCLLESRDSSSVIDRQEGGCGGATLAQGDCKWMDFLCPVPPDLPSDKKSLLELRAQLAMELLWIKQAIASRQKYLKLKQELLCQRE